MDDEKFASTNLVRLLWKEPVENWREMPCFNSEVIAICFALRLNQNLHSQRTIASVQSAQYECLGFDQVLEIRGGINFPYALQD